MPILRKRSALDVASRKRVDRICRRAMLSNWRLIEEGEDGGAFSNMLGTMHVIFSVSVELDGRRWLHVSVSREGKLPSWEDLVDVKSIFVGDDVDAYQVLPRKERYVNDNPFVLHLWHCYDAPDLIPDLRGGTGTI